MMRNRSFMASPFYLSAGVLLLATLAACERKPAQAPSSSAPVTAAIVEQEAANATYPSENSASSSIQLVDGHYGDTDQIETSLDTPAAVGDLDGDGSDDRVVMLLTSTGGSGVFRDLYVLRRVQGQLRVTQPAPLGDRVEIRNLRVENREIVLDLVIQGPDDPLCCPTQPATWHFRLDGDQLIETTGGQQTFLGG